MTEADENPKSVEISRGEETQASLTKAAAKNKPSQLSSPHPILPSFFRRTGDVTAAPIGDLTPPQTISSVLKNVHYDAPREL